MGPVATLRKLVVLALAMMLLPLPMSSIVAGMADSSEIETKIVTESSVTGSYTKNVSTYQWFTNTSLVDAVPLKIVAGNLNADGRTDIAVIYYGKSKIDIFYQRPEGNLSSTPNVTINITPYYPSDIAVADMDGDSKDDIAVCYPAAITHGGFRIYYQNSNFTHSLPAITLARNPQSIILANFNGDGSRDFAIVMTDNSAPVGNAQIQIFINSTDYYPIAVQPTLSGSAGKITEMLAADLNSDGYTDLILSDKNENFVFFYKCTSAAGDAWSLMGTLNIDRPVSIDVFSLGAGNPKIMIAGYGDGSNGRVYLYQWDGTTFAGGAKTPVISGLQNAKGVLLNNDALTDLVIVSNSTNEVSYYYSTSTNPSFTTANGTFPCQDRPIQLLVRGINADNKPDLAILQNRSSASGVVTVAYNCLGSFGNANDNFAATKGADSVLIGNFTQLHQTIAYWNRSLSTLYFYESGSWTQMFISSLIDVTTANLTRGPYQDLIYLDSSTSFKVILHGNTFYSKTPQSYAISLTNPTSIDCTDYDLDGYQDIIVRSADGFQVFINDHTGNGFTPEGVRVLDKVSFTQSTTADFDVWWEGQVPKPIGTDVAGLWDNGRGITVFFKTSDVSRFNWLAGNFVNLSLPATVTGRITWIGASDLTGDNWSDIVVGTSDGYLVLYPQKDISTGFDNSTSAKVIIRGDAGFADGVLGDYDDDGKNELAVVGSKASLITMYEFVGTSYSVAYHQTGGAGAASLAVGDVNGDVMPDLLIGSNNSKSVSAFYEMNRPPMASFTINVTIPTEGVQFTVNASGSHDTRSDQGRLTYTYYVMYNSTKPGGTWQLLSPASTSVTRNLTLMTNGTHKVRLDVRDPGGLTATFNQTVRVYDAGPTAKFTAPIGQYEGTPIQFTDSSTYLIDPIETSEWNFGDGTPVDTNKNPVHSFSHNGTYHVSLNVTDGDGNYSVVSHDVVILDALPTASFTWTPVNVYEGDDVAFDASTSTSRADVIIDYSWSIMNDTSHISTTSATTTYKFLDRGVYWVNLTVTENDTGKAWSNHTITVLDRTPSVTFDASSTWILEGETVTFQPHVVASVYDPVVSYLWDFGDGQTSTSVTPSHRYTFNGIFPVRLTVTDQDGSTAQAQTLTINVNDTNPEVGQIGTSDYQTNYYRNSNITFQVQVTIGYEVPTYVWTISTSAGIVAQTQTSVPSFYYLFTQAGTYHITLHVNDSDYATDRSMDITVISRPPVVVLSYTVTNLDQLTVQFYANGSYDPDGVDVLQYRWRFGDGSSWTEWSVDLMSTPHVYSEPGRYSASVMVRNAVYEVMANVTVVLDMWAPEVVIPDQISSAYVGDSVTIIAHITDDLGFQAYLFYSLDGSNYSRVVMTASDSRGNFSALIPAQEQTGTISYYIQAVDDNGNSVETSAVQLLINERPDQTWILMLLIVLIIIVVCVIIYLWMTKPVVDEVFVIYHDGNLIAHQTRRLKPGMDDQILGSMFVALQGFVKDSFKDESATGLKRMDFGEKKVMVEKGDFIYIAVVLNGTRTGAVPARLEKVKDSIDDKYGIDLIAWDGDLDKLRGVKDETQPLFERNNPFRTNGKKK